MDSVKVTAPGPDDVGGSRIDDGEREQAFHGLNITTASSQLKATFDGEP